MTSLVDALVVLRGRLVEARLPLDIGGVEQSRRDSAELFDQIDDYLLPRLRSLDAPLLAVIGGSTGSGKSTITNTLIGSVVSAAGVLRPTTRAPVLVCHPDDRQWFVDGGVLPELPRVTGAAPASGHELHIVAADTLPPGLAILDSPDIDSIETANHELAAQLLGAADLWLFVTTAARYADAVPWEYLNRARERATALALVINRIPPGAEAEVQSHLAEMLNHQGLGDANLFAIAEGAVDDSRLVAGAGPIREWLTGLVGDTETRNALVRSTLDGALASIPERLDRVADAVEGQVASADALSALAVHRYDEAAKDIDRVLGSGDLLRGEVLDSWQEHVGTGEFMQKLQRGIGRIRDRVKSIFTGRTEVDTEAKGQLESNLVAVVRDAADTAALDVVEGWESLPGGTQVLDNSERNLNRATADLSDRLKAEVEQWQDGVLELVNAQAGNKVAVARTLSVGINSVGVALMVAVFSHTGGVTGGEAGVAAGTAAVSQAMLSAVFGEQAVRDLANMAHDDLRDRIGRVLYDERARFDRLIAELPSDTAADDLRTALAELQGADDR